MAAYLLDPEEGHDYTVRTGGRPFLIRIEGQVIEVVSIAGLARALGRSSQTIRRWERNGLIPRAPIWLPSDDIHAVRRLYPTSLVAQIAKITERKPCGSLERQRMVFDAWSSTMRSLRTPNQWVVRTGRM